MGIGVGLCDHIYGRMEWTVEYPDGYPLSKYLYIPFG